MSEESIMPSWLMPQDGEGDDKRADQRIVGIDRRARRPEDERREQEPDADHGVRPLCPGEALRERQDTEDNDQQTAEQIAPRSERTAQRRLPQATLLRDAQHGVGKALLLEGAKD